MSSTIGGRSWRTGSRPHRTRAAELHRRPSAPTVIVRRSRDARTEGEFSIGEAAALVGVSTHVIRSWERRLAISLSRRTMTNQRRFRLEDIQRMIAIRRLHLSTGLPLADAADRALKEPNANPNPQYAALSSQALAAYWAALSDAIPEVLMVVDRFGKIVALNRAAKALLNARRGQQLARLAPQGWHRAYQSLYKTGVPKRKPLILAMATRSGVMFADVLVSPATHRASGEVVIFGSHVGRDGPQPA